MKKSLFSLLFVVGALVANEEDALLSYEGASKVDNNPFGDVVDHNLTELQNNVKGWWSRLQQGRVQPIPESAFRDEKNGALVQGNDVVITKATEGENSAPEQKAANTVVITESISSVEGSTANSILDTNAPVKEVKGDVVLENKTPVNTGKTSIKEKFTNLISAERMNEIKAYLKAHNKEILTGVTAVILIGTTVYILYETGVLKKFSTWMYENKKTVAGVVLVAALVAAAGASYKYNVYGAQTQTDKAVTYVSTAMNNAIKACREVYCARVKKAAA
jgi:hypothetical protein